MHTDYMIELAQAAEHNYEFSCSWRKAGQAVREHAMDEYGHRATDAQVATAVRLAQAAWEGQSIAVRQAILREACE